MSGTVQIPAVLNPLERRAWAVAEIIGSRRGSDRPNAVITTGDAQQVVDAARVLLAFLEEQTS